MVDTLLKRETEGTAAYGDALFWRGALAETAAEAERDYRRVIVEYPLSFYSDDALLAIAELEQARGDRAGALQHMLRFVREHPISAARGNAALAAARLAFEQRDTRIACTMITEARTSASPADVELRNQIEYFGTRCTSAVPAPDPASPTQVTAVIPSPTRDSAPTVPTTLKKVTAPASAAKSGTMAVAAATTSKVTVMTLSPASAPAATAIPSPTSPTTVRDNYTIQIAAYNTQAEANRLVAKLATRGVTARVSGTAKPFRVRLELYSTRQSAQDHVDALKKQGIVGFVTTEEPPLAGKTP